MAAETWDYRVIDFGTHCSVQRITYSDGAPTAYFPVDFRIDGEGMKDAVVEEFRLAIESVRIMPAMIFRDGAFVSPAD